MNKSKFIGDGVTNVPRADEQKSIYKPHQNPPIFYQTGTQTPRNSDYPLHAKQPTNAPSVHMHTNKHETNPLPS
jgi:hypothetical protein